MRQRALWLFIALLAATSAAEGYIDTAKPSGKSREASQESATPSGDIDDLFDAPFFDRGFDPFAEMRELEKQFGGGMDFPEIQARTVRTDKEVVVELTTPGLDKDSLAIRVEDGRIRVAYDARTVQDKEDAKGRRYFSSESVRHFEKVLSIPEDVDAAKSRVSREGNTVKISFPRRERALKADA